MKKSFTIIVIIWLTVNNCSILIGQETKFSNLCHLGNDRIDLSMEKTNNEYYLYANIYMHSGFYIEKDALFSIITLNNDTLNLIGLLDGQSDKYGGTRNFMTAVELFRFTNKYQIYPEQKKLLVQSGIKSIFFKISTGIVKMEVTSLRDHVIQELFEIVELK